MNILVLNGSPKGSYSITLQTIHYLEKLHPEHTFTILHVGQRIKAFEKDFSSAKEALEKAELILFAYPVYTFIAPSQLHRFIELMKEHGVNVADKYATQITTSKHFYDVTAHRYIQDNCQDMGMRFVRGLSADMEDLLTEKGQKEAESFWQHLCWSMEKGYAEPCYHINSDMSAPDVPVIIPEDTISNKTGNIVIVTDCTPENTKLSAMISRFEAVFPLKTSIVNLREYPFAGGCLGCFKCAVDGKCVYKDGFDTYLREEIQTAQAIVYAFTIRDHSMGSLFKMFDDRHFCNGHRTVTEGMPIGYLINGCFHTETNLQMIIEGRAQVNGNILAGIATDEVNPNQEIDKLAASLLYALENHNTQPQNFYGVGGMKIFRDLIYQMRGMMKADHRYYKTHGHYDFPQKKKGSILMMYLVGAMISSPKIKDKLGNKMNEGMLMPYKKLFEKMGKEIN
ncbi:MAG: NAD(P)H-dependent oxidoreductase [Lachnospiraceae bacterium]|nr:NAD(P)H-dependent oxidoreductase [Lachnospiraceae bacterium]